MELIPKLNLNRNPKDIPSNSFVAAKNVVIDDTGSYITNENGFKIAFECPNEHEFICGVIPTNKELVIFTYDTENKKSRIYRYEDETSYECNIGWEYSGGTITGSYTYNYKGELIIAVGEYNALDKNGNYIQVPFKCWNVDNCIPISHNQEEEIGNITATYDIVSGTLVCGTYTFFIRFAINDYDYTKWFQITPEIIIIDEVNKEPPTHTFLLNDGLGILQTNGKFEDFKVNSNKISDKGIRIKVSISDKFNKYQIGYVIKHDDEILGRIQNTYDANVNDITINNNVYAEETSIDKLVESPNQFYNVKNVINYNNRLYISNYEEYINENITTNAKIVTRNKELDDSETVIDKNVVSCQLYFRNNNDGIASVFDVTDVTKFVDENGNDAYKVNNIKQFVTNYIANNIKIYRTKGDAINIANSKELELTEEGKKIYRSAKEDYTLCICDKNNDPRYTFIYFSRNKSVANVNSIYFKKENNKWTLYFNANFNDKTNYDINIDNIFYNILIETTAYFTREHLAETGESYSTPYYYNHFITEKVLDGKYNGHYPTGGFSVIGSINATNYSYKYHNSYAITRSLIPLQRYNIFIHYIREDGSYTNGYFVDNISSEDLDNINYLEITTNSIPTGYIGYFYSYEDVEYNAVPVLGIESTGTATLGTFDDKFTNTDFIYNENNIYGDTINGFTFVDNKISKEYNKKSTSTANVEVLNANKGITIKDKYLFISNDNTYNKKVKTLYRLTSNKYEVGTIEETDYIPNFYNKEKVIVFTESNDNTKLKDLIFNPTSNKVVTDKGAETGYDIWLYNVYNYSINSLDAYNIKQDYSKGSASLVSSTGAALGVFYNSIITPDKLHDLLEIKSAYTSKPVKSYTNYSKDYTDKFNKTIRRSNVVSDESPINGFKDFDADQYKIIKENKGNITNVVGIGLYLLIHTQYSLFVFDRTPKLTQSSQLQIPDTFDIDYQEVLPSNEGFGGLWDKEESIVSKNGYIWYDRVNKYIFKYENGKCEVLSSDINNFIKDVNINTIRFGEDLETNRLLICIYIKGDNVGTITISYNFNTKTFVSLHDYSFTNCYRTYNQAYFFDNNKDASRLYIFDKSEHGYRNLSSYKDKLYFPTYEYKEIADDFSESKPDGIGKIPAITKAYIKDNTSVYVHFDLNIVAQFSHYRILFKKGSNAYVKTGYATINKNNTAQLYDSRQYFNFYDIAAEKTTLTYSEYKLYCILYEKEDDAKNDKDGKATNELTFNDDVRNDIIDAIKLVHNDVIKDNQYTINDYIDFTNISGLVFPITIKLSTEYLSTTVTYLGKTNLPSNTEYNVTVTMLGSESKRIIGASHLNANNFKNVIVSRNINDIIIEDTIDLLATRVYNINLFRDDVKLNKDKISFETDKKGYSFTTTNKIANKLSISCTMANITYKYDINIEDGVVSPGIYHTTKGEITIVKRDNTENVATYYSINDEEYKEYNFEEPPVIVLEDKQTIKCYNVYTEDSKQYNSKITEYVFYKDIKNAIEDLHYNKVEDTNVVLKNYVDIIYCRDIESTKSLESIQYILDVINAPFGTINLAEQSFARLENHKDGRYSGDSLILYSDETYSGEIDINDKGDNNIMNNYKYPTFQKGHWEFNNFRNGGTQIITADELNKIYANIPYVNDKGNTIIKSITLNDLYKSFGITSDESGIALRSDNRSLIYGKYIVARFIFNNDKKIKLQNVTFITNNY